MPFRIIRTNLTKVHADAIVNTANPMPVFGDGTDRAIYMAAGAEELPQAASPVTIAADAAMATTFLKIFLITQPPK